MRRKDWRRRAMLGPRLEWRSCCCVRGGHARTARARSSEGMSSVMVDALGGVRAAGVIRVATSARQLVARGDERAAREGGEAVGVVVDKRDVGEHRADGRHEERRRHGEPEVVAVREHAAHLLARGAREYDPAQLRTRVAAAPAPIPVLPRDAAAQRADRHHLRLLRAGAHDWLLCLPQPPPTSYSPPHPSPSPLQVLTTGAEHAEMSVASSQ